MKINIPQYLRAVVAYPDYDGWGSEKRTVSVFVGETVVFTHEIDRYYDDEEAEMEAVSQFGEKLKDLIEEMRQP